MRHGRRGRALNMDGHQSRPPHQRLSLPLASMRQHNNNNSNELPAYTGPPTDRAVQQPEAQGPVSTVSCMGRGAAGTHASWQKGARA